MFESLEDYIETFSSFSDLEIENFYFIFLYYGLICSLVFVAFSVHHLVKFARKMAIRFLLEQLIKADAPWRTWLHRGASILKLRQVGAGIYQTKSLIKTFLQRGLTVLSRWLNIVWK